jgi:DNA-binding response OmpR family regulator
VHETLTYENFEVRSTGESEEVMPLVEEFKPDLVILGLPRSGHLTAASFASQIKSHPKFGNVPVIIFSAYINRECRTFALTAAMPLSTNRLTLTELVEKVNNLINA